MYLIEFGLIQPQRLDLFKVHLTDYGLDTLIGNDHRDHIGL